MKTALHLAGLALVLPACQLPQEPPPEPPTDHESLAPPEVLAGVPVTRAPYDVVHVNWKHRLDQPYVYLEHEGDYRFVGESIRALLKRVEAGGVHVSGPLFCLYYDDPGLVPVESLRARVCLPVEAPPTTDPGLANDLLPSTTVAYAVVAGATWDVPRAYPGLFEYVSARGWSVDGPVREVYLNLPSVRDPASLLTEVQVPWKLRF